MPNCAIDRSPGRKPCSTRWKLVRLGKGKGLGLGSGLGLGFGSGLGSALGRVRVGVYEGVQHLGQARHGLGGGRSAGVVRLVQQTHGRGSGGEVRVGEGHLPKG